MTRLSGRSSFRAGSAEPTSTATPAGELLDLAQWNPTVVGLSGPARVQEVLCETKFRGYEPDPRGTMAAREAIAQSYGERGLAVEPRQVVCTASTSEAYAFLFKLLCDPGDEVLIPTPSYPLFDCLAQLESVRTVTYPLLREESFRIDTGALTRALSERTRAIVLVAPNNPTGTLVHQDDLAYLDELARRHGVALICDEVFADYLWPDLGGQLVRSLIGRVRAQCFVLSGLSKVMASPQLKLGWIVVGDPDESEVMRRLELIADTFLSVSTQVQDALPAMLALRAEVQGELRVRLAHNRSCLLELLEPPTRLAPSHGGWTALLELPRVMSEDAWVATLRRDASLLVQPGWFYDLTDGGTLALSLIAPPDEFREGVSRLLELVERQL